jgi:hypothetical protein
VMTSLFDAAPSLDVDACVVSAVDVDTRRRWRARPRTF